MNLFNLKGVTLIEVKSVPFKLESEIQQIVESNLSVLFGLELVRSEFSVGNLRIDSLAFDPQTHAFVIVEYKKGKNYSVIDQGYSYLSLLLNNKADFVLEYLEKTGKPLKKDDVDWSQSKVLFISPQFTNYQRQSVEFKDLPFELWEIKRYANNTITMLQHRSTSQESVKSVAPNNESSSQVNQEIKVYAESDHISKGSAATIELYESLRERIMDLEGMELVPVKQYIGFKLNKRVVTDLEIQKKQLKVRINLKFGQLDDPRGMFSNVSQKGHWGVGDYETAIKPEGDLDYLMSLIRQSYKFHSS